jgi:integrase
MYNIPELALAKFHVKQKLPFPLELEIDTLIHSFRNKNSCYLQPLKETGMCPIEAFSLEWTDLDTVQKTVNVRTAKQGLPRILPISDLFLNRVFRLKNESKHIFASEKEAVRFDLSLEHFTRGYLKNRKTVSEKLQNPRLRQISLDTFRHWKATMLYLRTRDFSMLKHSLVTTG